MEKRKTSSRPPTRTSRPSRLDVRTRLLEAALHVFSDRGFDAASMDDVAAAAGFTKGALYSNFTSKDELFLTMMDLQVTARIDVIRTVLTESDGNDIVHDTHKLGVLLQDLSLANERWQLLFLDYWARAVRDRAVRVPFRRHRRALRQAIGDALRSRLPAALATDDHAVDDLTTAILALSNGLAIERMIDRDAVNPALAGRLLLAAARTDDDTHTHQ